MWFNLSWLVVVAQEKDFDDAALGFHPDFTHQVFGEKWGFLFRLYLTTCSVNHYGIIKFDHLIFNP